jgi:hypothetical protein
MDVIVGLPPSVRALRRNGWGAAPDAAGSASPKAILTRRPRAASVSPVATTRPCETWSLPWKPPTTQPLLSTNTKQASPTLNDAMPSTTTRVPSASMPPGTNTVTYFSAAPFSERSTRRRTAVRTPHALSWTLVATTVPCTTAIERRDICSTDILCRVVARAGAVRASRTRKSRHDAARALNVQRRPRARGITPLVLLMNRVGMAPLIDRRCTGQAPRHPAAAGARRVTWSENSGK